MYGLSKKSLGCWIKAFLIILIVSGNALAQPQELPKEKPAQPAQTKQQSSPYKRGTKDLPVIVEIAPPSSLKVETDRDPEKEKEKAENDGLIAKGTVALAVFTFILACATIGLMIFTAKLWGANKKLIEGAKDTAERQLRAYISISGGEMKEGDHLGFMVKFNNAGQTPAYELVSGTRCEVAPYPTAGVLAPVPLTDKSRSTLGPGISTGLFASRTNLTPDEKASLENMTAAIYIHGRIEYRDAFKEPRVTNFRLIYRKNQAGHYLIGNDREGNDAT